MTFSTLPLNVAASFLTLAVAAAVAAASFAARGSSTTGSDTNGMYFSGAHQWRVRAYSSRQSAAATCAAPKLRSSVDTRSKPFLASAALLGVFARSFRSAARTFEMVPDPPLTSPPLPLPRELDFADLEPTALEVAATIRFKTPWGPFHRCATTSGSVKGRRKGAWHCAGCRRTYLILSSVMTRFWIRVAPTPAAVARANDMSYLMPSRGFSMSAAGSNSFSRSMYCRVSAAHLTSHVGHSVGGLIPGILSAADLIPADTSAALSSVVTVSAHARIRSALRSRKLCRRDITLVKADDPE
mmetsp:Transcript_23721/g.58790  ORF Transcript_23721/g.58790 Transcript_23721/m.58790 type:complete len:299 (-) Transcript_23721:1975-2871(-)